MSSLVSHQQQQQMENVYRVGDYVFFESVGSAPYTIRRIEELNRTVTGNVEARVICFYRRSEVPTTLVAQADKHHWGETEPPADADIVDSDDEEVARDAAERAERQQMKQRELFLSRQVETLPATLIRGKCTVTLLSEVETSRSYCGREDAFFYALVYDPIQKSLVADRGEIRIGSGYQAVVPPLLAEGESDGRGEGVVDAAGITFPNLEERLWIPPGTNGQQRRIGGEEGGSNGDATDDEFINSLSEDDIDKFLIVSRSVGTFARALDCSSSIKQPSLHMSAAAASRDVTLFHAYDLLHRNRYDVAEALRALVPSTGPVLCRDEMEDWSASEANLFEEAVEKYGKDFNDIRKDFLPWKSMKNLIEYFFMWKTTDRYVQQKRVKAMEAESKLKQVLVPAYKGSASSRMNGANGEIIIRGRDCDAYPNMSRYSWIQYKKYGKFVAAVKIDDSFIMDKPSFSSSAAQRLAQLRPGLIIEPGSPAASVAGGVLASGGGGMHKIGGGGSGKTRAAFYLRTTPISRAARRVCAGKVSLRHFSRRPDRTIDMKAVKADATDKMKSLNVQKIRELNSFVRKVRVGMEVVVKRLGQDDDSTQSWLLLTPKNKMARPEKEFFPRPPKRRDGSYIYDRVAPSADATAAAAAADVIAGASSSNNASHIATPPPQMLYKKRAYEENRLGATTATVSSVAGAAANVVASSGGDHPAKVQRTDGRQHVPNVVPPKGRVATLTRIQGGQRQVISWMDAPDDVFYKATLVTKRIRKRMPVVQLRRAARKPFKKVLTLQ